MATKKEKQGTIHELEYRLAEIEQAREHKPHTKNQIAKYIKDFNRLKLFPKNADKKKKTEIIKNIAIINFDENSIIENQIKLKSLLAYNRLVEKEKIKLENQIKSGKNVKQNDKILKLQERIEINIPQGIRNDLGIHDKAIRLVKYSPHNYKNKIKYNSGQDYDFLVKNGFGKPIFIPYDKLQEIRKNNNVVEYLLKQFEKDVLYYYDKDKRELSKSKKPGDKQKWKAKKKAYDKILNEVIVHNMEIATNKKYNKPFVKRDSKGNINKKKDSEIPVFMKIYDELIDLFIP